MDKAELRELTKQFHEGIKWLKEDACMFGFERYVSKRGFNIELTGRGEKELDYEERNRFDEIQEIGQTLDDHMNEYMYNHFIKWLNKEG